MPNESDTQTPTNGGAPGLRIDVDPDDLTRSFAGLVIAIAEILRELMERQTIRRMEAGDLDEMQIERMGTTLLRLKDELWRLRDALDVGDPQTREKPNDLGNTARISNAPP